MLTFCPLGVSPRSPAAPPPTQATWGIRHQFYREFSVSGIDASLNVKPAHRRLTVVYVSLAGRISAGKKSGKRHSALRTTRIFVGRLA
jgi:hypothetical protein